MEATPFFKEEQMIDGPPRELDFSVHGQCDWLEPKSLDGLKDRIDKVFWFLKRDMGMGPSLANTFNDVHPPSIPNSKALTPISYVI